MLNTLCSSDNKSWTYMYYFGLLFNPKSLKMFGTILNCLTRKTWRVTVSVIESDDFMRLKPNVSKYYHICICMCTQT